MAVKNISVLALLADFLLSKTVAGTALLNEMTVGGCEVNQ